MGDSTTDKVISILTNIKNKKEDDSNTDSAQIEVKSKNKKTLLKPKHDLVRGKPKSGKFWKSSRDKFSSINKTKGLKQDFQKKTALRMELQRTKELSRQIQEEMKQKELDRKERRRENLKRTEENRLKAEVVQVITNTSKLKRMRKKQLRFIQKRDTNKEIEANK